MKIIEVDKKLSEHPKSNYVVVTKKNWLNTLNWISRDIKCRPLKNVLMNSADLSNDIRVFLSSVIDRIHKFN